MFEIYYFADGTTAKCPSCNLASFLIKSSSTAKPATLESIFVTAHFAVQIGNLFGSAHECLIREGVLMHAVICTVLWTHMYAHVVPFGTSDSDESRSGKQKSPQCAYTVCGNHDIGFLVVGEVT